MKNEHEKDLQMLDYFKGGGILLYDLEECNEVPEHWHNAVELVMPVRNDFEIACSGKRFLLKERDILVIPAGELHSFAAISGRRLVFQCDNGAVLGNPALKDLRSVLEQPTLISHEQDPELLSALNRLFTDIYTLYMDYSAMSGVYIYIKFLTMLSRIMGDKLDSGARTAGKNFDKMQLAFKYIDENYMYPITLDDIAAAAGYSKYHFSRMFSLYTSTNLTDFLNRKRIKEASLLLIGEDITVTEAAMKSGFSSLTTFNRVFKEIKGCTPTEFKKLYKFSDDQ